MATFGQSALNGTTARSIVNRVEGSVFTCPGAGTVTKLTAYIFSRDQSNKWAGAIYDSTGTNVIANGVTDERDIGGEGEAGWEDFVFSTNPTVAAATDYFLCLWGNHADCLFYQVQVDNNAYSDGETYNYPTFPEPHAFTVKTGKGPFYIYATYTPSGVEHTHSASDTLTMSDSMAPVMKFGHAATDTLSISETLAAVAAYKHSASDTLSISDALKAVASYKHSVSDTLEISDALVAAIIEAEIRRRMGLVYGFKPARVANIGRIGV